MLQPYKLKYHLPKVQADTLSDSSRLQMIEDLYHSGSYDEIQLKLARYGSPKLNVKDLCYWTKTVIYHAAWHGNIDRLEAFIGLISRSYQVGKTVSSVSYIKYCQRAINFLPFKTDVPGKAYELQYWAKMLNIALEKHTENMTERN